jgi:hypothetical protein
VQIACTTAMTTAAIPARRSIVYVPGPMTPRARTELLQDLARAKAQLADLDRSREEMMARVQALRAELDSAPAVPLVATQLPLAAGRRAPQTAAEKVELFRSLFRGRTDVFPTRFVSKKTNKPGYAPACTNKWEPGLCVLKTGGKCTTCANQAFAPVSDQVIAYHLKGRHVIGVYPLLEDETCWFLAVDFDKHSWTDDVSAFAETCRSVGVPIAIERSRSGNGAHAWFFFGTPLPASVARRMGCHLITETMNRRHELSMDSYDRLFPNQDTMPRGGFGNLIALPLQREPRQNGNSVFVDEHLAAYADQWAFLASMGRLEPSTVETIAREATKTGKVVGVRLAEAVDDEEAATPWTRPPSHQSPTDLFAGPLPSAVNAVLAQRLFIEKAGLPSPVLNRLKRLAAFQNPDFYKKQRMRLSTALTPRVIACAEDLDRFVALPRGCVGHVEELLGEHGVKLTIDDKRHEGAHAELAFHGELTPVQEAAARALLAHDTGVFVGPPGIGKTVLGTYLVAKRAKSTLILVHRKPLLEQWVAQLAMFLGIDESNVGQIGGGKRKPNGTLDVAMIQSLVRKDKVEDLVASYGHVVVDECHHLPAVSFERVLCEVKAHYLLGLTATPQRRDGHQPIIEMQLGPVRFKVDAKSQAARRPLAHKLIVRETDLRLRRMTRRRAFRLSTARWLPTTPATAESSTTSSRSWRRAGHQSYSPSARTTSSASPSASVRLSATSSSCREARRRRSGALWRQSSRQFPTLLSGSSLRRAATSARGSMTPGSTLSFWRCPCRGRARWCSTAVACKGIIPARPRFASMTTSTGTCRCCSGCLRNGSRRIEPSGTHAGKRHLASPSPLRSARSSTTRRRSAISMATSDGRLTVQMQAATW